jgi:hypothetical protein
MLISIIGSSGTHGKVALGICVHTGQLVRRLGMSQGGVAMQWAEMPADLQLPWDANISEVLLMALSAPKDQKASLRYEQTHLVQTCGVELCQLQPGDKGSSERRDLAVGTSVSGGPHLLQDDARLIEYRQVGGTGSFLPHGRWSGYWGPGSVLGAVGLVMMNDDAVNSKCRAYIHCRCGCASIHASACIRPPQVQLCQCIIPQESRDTLIANKFDVSCDLKLRYSDNIVSASTRSPRGLIFKIVNQRSRDPEIANRRR